MARRSAKQRAATRKLVAFNRAKAKKKSSRKAPKRRRQSSPKRPSKRRRKAAKKTNKPKRSSKPMVRGLGKIPIIGSPIVKKAAAGIGIATIGVTLLSLVAPTIAQNPIVRPALAFLGGGVPGVVASIFLQGGAQLGNLFGGRNGNGPGANAAA